jgi:integrase
MLIDISDKSIAKLPPGVHRDKKLKGFMAVVSPKGRRTFRLSWDQYSGGKRIKSHSRALGVWSPTYSAEDARKAAKELTANKVLGTVPADPRKGVTLGAAMEDYIQALDAAGRTVRWQEEQRGFFRRNLSHWEHHTLAWLSGHPAEVRDWHLALTKTRGTKGVEANKSAGLLRTIYANATELDRSLPPQHPCTGVLWNHEERADKAPPFEALPAWSKAVDVLERVSPMRALFHRLCAYTGQRPSTIGRLLRSEVDFGDHTIVIAKSKTGKPLTIPTSPQIEAVLRRALEAGKGIDEASLFVFPAMKTATKSGHFSDWNADAATLGYTAGAWRHFYRTLAAALGIDALSIRLLQGHAISGVSEGYITRQLLVGTSLREQQAKISNRLTELMA